MRKSIVAAGTLIVEILLGTVVAQATPGWVQQPGNATQISVGASDYPFILDTNGYIQYLDRSRPDPNCHFAICPGSDRQWVTANTQSMDWYHRSAPPSQMNMIATDLYGQVWSIDRGGGLWVGHTEMDGVALQLWSGVSTCATSMAPGFMQYPVQWNHAFGVGTLGTVNVYNPQQRNYGSFYMTGCDEPSLFSKNFVWHGYTVDNHPSDYITSDGWQQLDTGETQVTLFTVDGSADQVPWIVAPMSNGRPTVWAWNNGTVQWVQPPTYHGQPVAVVYATDHYVVAHNHVYRWNGDAYGNQGWPVWIELANSFPDDGTIVQIAYASALPGTADGTVGPSNLWMVDSNTNIWYWGDVGPVK